MEAEDPGFTVITEGHAAVVRLNGPWAMRELESVHQLLRDLRQKLPQETDHVVVRGDDLRTFDTAGALFVMDVLEGSVALKNVTFEGFSPAHSALLEIVAERRPAYEQKRSTRGDILANLGRESVDIIKDALNSTSFLGEFFSAVMPILAKPYRLRMKELAVQLELAVVKALPVISLVNCLIGMVVAYIFADQVQRYGANIFVVDGVSVAMSRELTPLIVAIVMAGRSGSSFTAQIGAMKINQEVDAIEALGLSIMQILVIPRVVALIIALPLLVILGDVVGILGGVIIADLELGVTPVTFLERLHDNVSPRHFWIGVVKAPVFALFVALIGCRMGLVVENNTRSLGINTTSTVVQSIVVVIILDAMFAVLFMKLGL